MKQLKCIILEGTSSHCPTMEIKIIPILSVHYAAFTVKKYIKQNRFLMEWSHEVWFYKNTYDQWENL